MFGKIIKELLKWILITLLIGFIVWIIHSIYKTIRYGIRGSK